MSASSQDCAAQRAASEEAGLRGRLQAEGLPHSLSELDFEALGDAD
jgi:hypothetical protein